MDRKESFFFFYRSLGRPLSIMEIASFFGKETLRTPETYDASIPDMARRKQDLLLDEKWKLLIKRTRWFRFIPFVEFIVASGSMAIGNVHEGSDFDVLVGVREGRIFTVRYLLNFIFSLLRARRLDDKEGTSPDKLCFNHFVTEKVFAKEPFNFYRAELYRTMVPIYGSRMALERFFTANAWSGASPERNLEDLRFREKKPNMTGKALAHILNGRFGDFIERKVFMPIAMRRLGAYIGTKKEKGRVVVSEEELEFHFQLPYEERFKELTLNK